MQNKNAAKFQHYKISKLRCSKIWCIAIYREMPKNTKQKRMQSSDGTNRLLCI